MLGNGFSTAIVKISNADVRDNVATDYAGFAIESYSYMTVWLDVTITSSHFEGNNATMANSALAIDSGCSATIERSKFIRNRTKN